MVLVTSGLGSGLATTGLAQVGPASKVIQAWYKNNPIGSPKDLLTESLGQWAYSNP